MTAVVGAIVIELVVLLIGLLLFNLIAPAVSFLFAGLVLLTSIWMLRQRSPGHDWAARVALWSLVGAAILIGWNVFRAW